MKPKLIVNYGLPKTGTSFLGEIFKQDKHSSISVSKVKEPTFNEYDFRFGRSTITDNIIVNGNFHLGKEWYINLFDDRNVLLDLSTQYWINDIKLDGDLTIQKFLIRRDPFEQIISYISHLRRGYIPRKSLKSIIDSDRFFSKYLREMYEYGCHTYSSEFPNTNIKVFDFETLIKSPYEFSSNFSTFFDFDFDCMLNLNVHKNSKSLPKNFYLNSLLMSRSVNSFIKDLVPKSMLTYLINFRKWLINSNLKYGDKVFPFEKDDRIFLKSWLNNA